MEWLNAPQCLEYPGYYQKVDWEEWEWKMEQKMEKLYQTHINLMIYPFLLFLKVHFVSFIFAQNKIYLSLMLSWNQHTLWSVLFSGIGWYSYEKSDFYLKKQSTVEQDFLLFIFIFTFQIMKLIEH